MWGDHIEYQQSYGIFGLYLFDLNLGSTLSLAPVPSTSHLRSCGESTPDPVHLWLQSNPCLTLDYVGGQLCIHIFVVPFEAPLHLQLQSHLCLTLHHAGWSFWVPTILCYLQIEHSIPYFCLSQYYLLHLYTSHISHFSSTILIALNDNLELTVLCRLWDFFKD